MPPGFSLAPTPSPTPSPVTIANPVGSKNRTDGIDPDQQFLNQIVPGLRREQRSLLEEVEVNGRTEVKKMRPYVWIFPPVDVCREAWEEKYGEAHWAVSAD